MRCHKDKWYKSEQKSIPRTWLSWVELSSMVWDKSNFYSYFKWQHLLSDPNGTINIFMWICVMIVFDRIVRWVEDDIAKYLWWCLWVYIELLRSSTDSRWWRDLFYGVVSDKEIYLSELRSRIMIAESDEILTQLVTSRSFSVLLYDDWFCHSVLTASSLFATAALYSIATPSSHWESCRGRLTEIKIMESLSVEESR